MRALPMLTICAALSGCGAAEVLNNAPLFNPGRTEAPASKGAAAPIRPSGLRPDPNRPARAPTAEERSLIEEAVRKGLKDPASASFGENMLVAGTTFSRDPNIWLACGTVNARNSYGGYTGAQAFVSIVGRDQGVMRSTPIEVGGDNLEQRVTMRMCQDVGINLW